MNRRTSCAALLATLLVVAMVAPVSAAPPVKVGVAYDIAGLGDGAFNDGVQVGVTAAEEDFGIKLFEQEQVTKSGRVLDAQSLVQKLEKKSDLVIGVGFLLDVVFADVAAAEPDTNFALIDVGFFNPPANLLGATTAAHEGSFLVGAAAGLHTSTGQVGYIGGMDFDFLVAYETGYRAGVDHVSDAGVHIAYAGTFSDPGAVYEIAMGMYRSGVDVIYHAAGGAGLGLFAAAREYSLANGVEVAAIGVDVDQYWMVPDDQKPYVLTSMVKRVDQIAYDLVEMQVTGTFAGGNHEWGVAENGVGYATSGDLIGPYITALDNLAAQIAGGSIIVPSTP